MTLDQRFDDRARALAGSECSKARRFELLEFAKKVEPSSRICTTFRRDRNAAV
jgi:hypothetical protein